MTSSISSAMATPAANASEQSRMELQARLNGLGGLNGRQLSPEAKEKKLREACEGFESIFIQKMWQEMRNAVPKSGLMHGREEKFWQDMYDQELSKSMTKAGGIGLADMMYEQLSRTLVSASRSAAGTGMASPFTPGPAPLVVETPDASHAMADYSASQHMPINSAASIYDGEAPDTAPIANEIPVVTTKNDMQNQQSVEPLATTPANPVMPAASSIVAAAAEQQPAPVKTRTEHVKPQRHVANGLEMAQIAKRDAGDKLGSRAVRPPLHQQRQSQHKEQQQNKDVIQQQQVGTIAQTGGLQPGSPEALRAAVEMAKTGAPQPQSSSSMSLNQIVASVQAQNASQATQNITQDSEQAPVVRKVRYSTNIPQNNKNASSKKAKQAAIRMLNVDNVGAHSKAGQGLAAYHAQQEAMQANAQLSNQGAAQQSANMPQSGQTQQTMQAVAPEATSQPIAPLTASQAGKDVSEAANFAIPPLTSADSRG